MHQYMSNIVMFSTELYQRRFKEVIKVLNAMFVG